MKAGLLSFMISMLFSLSVFSQEFQADSIMLKYKLARIEYERFERDHGHFVETTNGKIHYLTWGDPGDNPLIWMHGSFTNAYEIKELADKIVQAGYYLIAIDYYGHGKTLIPSHEVSIYDVAEDMLNIMDEEGLDQAIIGGWSRGAYIATAFYDIFPDRVKALILEDGGSVNFNSHFNSLNDTELAELVNKLFSDRTAYKTFNSEFEVYQEYHDSNDNSLQFELLAWIAQDSDGYYTIGPGIEELFHMKVQEQFLMNIKDPSSSSLFARSMALLEPMDIFQDLKVNLLILDPANEYDLFPFERENKGLKNMHPDLVIHKVYENTGHNIHYEKPELFLQDVLKFLKDLD